MHLPTFDTFENILDLRPWFPGIILRTRPKKIAPRYESIWMQEGSPLRVYTQRMTDALEASLEDVRCEVGMRYGNPSIRTGLQKLKDSGVDELLLAPLFLQAI